MTCPALLLALQLSKQPTKAPQLKHAKGTSQALNCLILNFMFVLVMGYACMIKVNIIKQFLLCLEELELCVMSHCSWIIMFYNLTLPNLLWFLV